MKKILSLALAAMMVVSVLPVAYAADVDYTAGTAVEYTADADANRSYTITVPAELQPGQSGTVTLKGMWASNETVKVTADASVELTNSINAADKHTLDIEFAGIEKAGDNTVEKTYTETVAVAEMPENAIFGTWSGKFNYNVEFDDGVAAPLVRFGGLYVADNETAMIEFTEDGEHMDYIANSKWTGLSYDGDEIYGSSGLLYTVSADGSTVTRVASGKTYVYTDYPEFTTLTIGDTEYQVAWGMTWGEWLESEYNTDGITVEAQTGNRYLLKTASGKTLGDPDWPGSAATVTLESKILVNSVYVINS